MAKGKEQSERWHEMHLKIMKFESIFIAAWLVALAAVVFISTIYTGDLYEGFTRAYVALTPFASAALAICWAWLSPKRFLIFALICLALWVATFVVIHGTYAGFAHENLPARVLAILSLISKFFLIAFIPTAIWRFLRARFRFD